MPERTGAPPPRRRLLRHGVAILAGLLFVELAAWGLYWLRNGEPMSLAALAEARRRIVAGEGDTEDLPRADPEDTHVKWTTHPYLGYVLDPHVETWLTPDATAVWGVEGEVPPRRGDDRFIVGIFGGSVAFMMGNDHGDALMAELQTLHPDRQPILVVAATPSWKQPQSLFALEWLGLRGYEFDLVIELDGLNEVAGAATNYRYHHTHTAYPYNYRAFMASSAEGPQYLALAGELTLLKRDRQRRASWLAGGPLAWSPTLNLIWATWDQGAQARMETLRAELEGAVASDARRYGRQGPREDHGDSLRDSAPLVEALADLYERSSRRMAEVARDGGAEFALFLQPNQYVPGSKPFTDEERAESLVSEHLAEIVPTGYAALRARGAAMNADGIVFEDLTGIFAEVDERVYSDWCCHLNGPGNERMIAAIGARLRARRAALETP